MIKISQISFPVYKIGTLEPTKERGLIYFLRGKDTEYSDAKFEVSVVDNKNRTEHSLGLRRLAMSSEGIKLHKLGSAIYFIGDFIKVAKAGIWFIDARGNAFTYTKSTRLKLVFKRITKLIPIPSGGAIVEVEGTTARFKILFAPSTVQTHAGLLAQGNSYILYGLYDKEYASTTRMI